MPDTYTVVWYEDGTTDVAPIADADDSDLIALNGIKVSRSSYLEAPDPIDCSGTDDGSECEDPDGPCRACFLYDDRDDTSRYWDDVPPPLAFANTNS